MGRRGEVSGRHCYLQLKRVGGVFKQARTASGNCVDMQSTDTMLLDTLHTLAGLQHSPVSVGPEKSGWLYDAVFAKAPEKIIKEVVGMLLNESLETDISRLTPTQVRISHRNFQCSHANHPFPGKPTLPKNVNGSPSGNCIQHLAIFKAWSQLDYCCYNHFLFCPPPPASPAYMPCFWFVSPHVLFMSLLDPV